MSGINSLSPERLESVDVKFRFCYDPAHRCTMVIVLTSPAVTGSLAAEAAEPRQVREEAALRR